MHIWSWKLSMLVFIRLPKKGTPRFQLSAWAESSLSWALPPSRGWTTPSLSPESRWLFLGTWSANRLNRLNGGFPTSIFVTSNQWHIRLDMIDDMCIYLFYVFSFISHPFPLPPFLWELRLGQHPVKPKPSVENRNSSPTEIQWQLQHLFGTPSAPSTPSENKKYCCSAFSYSCGSFSSLLQGRPPFLSCARCCARSGRTPFVVPIVSFIPSPFPRGFRLRHFPCRIPFPRVLGFLFQGRPPFLSCAGCCARSGWTPFVVPIVSFIPSPFPRSVGFWLRHFPCGIPFPRVLDSFFQGRPPFLSCAGCCARSGWTPFVVPIVSFIPSPFQGSVGFWLRIPFPRVLDSFFQGRPPFLSCAGCCAKSGWTPFVVPIVSFIPSPFPRGFRLRHFPCRIPFPRVLGFLFQGRPPFLSCAGCCARSGRAPLVVPIVSFIPSPFPRSVGFWLRHFPCGIPFPRVLGFHFQVRLWDPFFKDCCLPFIKAVLSSSKQESAWAYKKAASIYRKFTGWGRCCWKLSVQVLYQRTWFPNPMYDVCSPSNFLNPNGVPWKSLLLLWTSPESFGILSPTSSCPPKNARRCTYNNQLRLGGVIVADLHRFDLWKSALHPSLSFLFPHWCWWVIVETCWNH